MRAATSAPATARTPLRAIRALGLAVALLSLISACERAAAPPQKPIGDAAQRQRGQALLAAYGCVACHHVKGMAAQERLVGPPLDRIAENSYVGGVLPNDAAAMVRFIMTPRQVSPATAMPALGVSADDARAITAYLYSQ